VEPTMAVVMLPLRVMLSPTSGHLLRHYYRHNRGKVKRKVEGFWGGDINVGRCRVQVRAGPNEPYRWL
jgi:hypothetical protein